MRYIDAFAGDGSILIEPNDGGSPSLFEDILPTSDPEVEGLIKGSAERALSLDPGFDTYILVEKARESVERLERLKEKYPASEIEIVHGDANAYLQGLEELNWEEHRAVVFLDPTGMQVSWETMEALADTGAADVWTWFPIGAAVNRLLPRDKSVPPEWAQALNRVFGTDEWEEAFYEPSEQPPLFPEASNEGFRKKASAESIAEYYNERLQTIFPAVAPSPRIMVNSKNAPIYSLSFAAANPGRGGKIAVNIASHLLLDRI